MAKGRGEEKRGFTEARPHVPARLARLMPRPMRQTLQAVGRVAAKQGCETYLVGGAVRDLLLGEPNYDLDVTVLGDAHKVGKSISRALGGRFVAHGQLGTAVVHAQGMRIDLATARAETYPRPGALPRVRPGTLEQDLLRRDFTVNTLAARLDADFGRLVDLCGGAEDVRRGLIRVLHEGSFLDDPTRILRAVRLAESRSLRLASGTRRLAMEALGRGALATLSGTRLRDQLVSTLGGVDAAACARRLARLGFWEALHPRMSADREALRIIRNLASVRARLEEEPPCGWWALNFLALAQRLSPGESEALAARLALRASEREALLETARLRAPLKQKLSARNLSRGRIWALLREVPLSTVVFLAAALAAKETGGRRLRRFVYQDREAQSPLRGDELLHLGVPKGPAVGRMLKDLTAARIEGKVRTKSDAAAWVRRRLRRARRKE